MNINLVVALLTVISVIGIALIVIIVTAGTIVVSNVSHHVPPIFMWVYAIFMASVAALGVYKVLSFWLDRYLRVRNDYKMLATLKKISTKKSLR